jgi:D-beta-D-heptose 7-phosphate kinase/D-beta-D-heptose 1-phosphate adenosyltransferase
MDKALGVLDDFDVVLFSDYDHGALTPEITSIITRECLSKGKHVVVDSKAMDSFSKYNMASVMLPNDTESRVMTGMHNDPIREVALNMKTRMQLKAIGVTLGAKGILLIDGDKEEVFPPYGDDEVVDITGAGDTAAAAVALALARNASMDDAMRLANIMGGIVVMKRGVATASPREVEEAIEKAGGQ